MIPAVLIIALLLEPIEPITMGPWAYVTEPEIIDLGPTVEEMEMQLRPQEAAE